MVKSLNTLCAACPLHNACYIYNYFPTNIGGRLIVRNVKPDKSIITQGHDAEGIYFLCKGQVKLHRIFKNGTGMTRDILMGAQFISYKAVLLNEPHLYSAFTMERSTILMLPKGELASIKYDPAVLKSFMKLQLYDYRNFEATVSMYTHDPADRQVERVLVYLYAMQRRVNQSNPEQLKYSRQDIAEFAALTQETVVRKLKELEADGLVHTQGRLVVVLEPLIKKYEYAISRYIEPIKKRISS
jgi:CRP-like cAMP-binding protein